MFKYEDLPASMARMCIQLVIRRPLVPSLLGQEIFFREDYEIFSTVILPLLIQNFHIYRSKAEDLPTNLTWRLDLQV